MGFLAKGSAALVVCTMLLTATNCASEATETAASSQSPTTTTKAVASATVPTSTSSANSGPQSVDVPKSLADGSVVAGTLVSSDYCTVAQEQVQVFDPTDGKLITVSAPPERADETRSDLKCTVFTRNGSYYVAFTESSQTRASGLNGSEPRNRLHVYPLGSTTPTVTDLKGFPLSLVSTDAGPALVLQNGDDYSLAVFGGEGPTPTWTAPTSVNGITSSGPAILTEHELQLTILDAATGKPLYSRCASDQAGLGARISDGFVTVRDACGQGSRLVGYDSDSNKEVFSLDLAPASGLFGPDDLSASSDYLLVDDDKSLLVIDRKSGEIVVNKSGDDLEKLNIQNAFVFADRLYLATNTGDTSVVRLPDGTTESESWKVRPTTKLDGWTLVIRDSGDRELIRDQNGTYPGPWY